MELPPMPVAEKIIFPADASSSIRNHWLAELATWKAPSVVGNPLDVDIPLTRIWPWGVRAMPLAMDAVDPPMSTEKTTAPLGSSLVINERVSLSFVGGIPSVPPPTDGKYGFWVQPAT